MSVVPAYEETSVRALVDILGAEHVNPHHLRCTMMAKRITLPADVHQIDATGHVWSFLDQADAPDRMAVGSVVVARDSDDPFLARVIDIITGSSEREIVHLDVARVPDQVIDELRHANLLPA